MKLFGQESAEESKGRCLLGKITLDCPSSSPYMHAIFSASVPAESHKAVPAADHAIMIFQWLRERAGNLNRSPVHRRKDLIECSCRGTSCCLGHKTLV